MSLGDFLNDSGWCSRPSITVTPPLTLADRLDMRVASTPHAGTTRAVSEH